MSEVEFQHEIWLGQLKIGMWWMNQNMNSLVLFVLYLIGIYAYWCISKWTYNPSEVYCNCDSGSHLYFSCPLFITASLLWPVILVVVGGWKVLVIPFNMIPNKFEREQAAVKKQKLKEELSGPPPEWNWDE